MKNVYLYGPPGSGKTTIGEILAKNLGLGFVDLDKAIEGKAGISISEFFSEHGEASFRELESATLEELAKDKTGVIALGGGTLLRPENRSLAETNGEVICLTANPATLLDRLAASVNSRPLLSGDPKSNLTTLLEKRRSHYESFPVHFSGDDLPPQKIAWRIQISLGRFQVSGMGKPYDVLVGKGDDEGHPVRPSSGIVELGSLLLEYSVKGPIAVVTDSNVDTLYGKAVRRSLQNKGYESTVISFPAGESSKTVDTVMNLWHGFLHAGLDRHSTVVALGGGVVGDLAGFAASTYMRGCPWVVVPTTLLSMVDSSLGGKTGFDLPEGKNLVGAFYPPSLVIADPSVLSTLPEREMRSGLAEVVKHGLISDPELFETCSGGYGAVLQNLAGVICRGIAVKVDVIQADPFEKGIRAALNLGHTVGHAVELASGFSLLHGEAISIGMVAEARLAEKLGLAGTGLAEQISLTLKRLGLPTCIPDQIDKGAILQAMKLDKKKSSKVVRFALPVEIGKVEVGVGVKDLELVFEE